MNLTLTLILLAVATFALFWRGRSGMSLSEAWPPGLGLLVHGAIVLLAALALSGCFSTPEPAKKQEPQGEPYHEQAYEP
jgi:hypothetical protein